MSEDLRSICILRLSAVGDACNAAASVQAIQRQYPNAEITWIIGKIEHQLLEGLPNVEFIVYDKALGRSGFRALKNELQNRKFDVLLHMQVAARANRIARKVNAERKIGYDWKRAKEGHSLVVKERIPALTSPIDDQHVLDSFLQFAAYLGVDAAHCYPPRWEIPTSDADEEFARLTIPGDTQALVICPAASKAERCWLPERYADVAHYAHRKGLSVILCGGPGELDKTLAQEIIKRTRISVLNLVGQTSLKQLYALLKRALFVVSPDTGPLHMANAAGTPVVGLYAHSDPSRTGPYNSQRYVVSQYADHLLKQFGKDPAHVKWGQRVYGESLMESIQSRDVYERMDALLLDLSD